MQVKQLILIMLCFLFSSVTFAEYSANDLQKLFTDKKQRARLDAARSGVVTTPNSPQTSKVKVSGYLTRSDGKSVVWLNNKNTIRSSRMGDVRVNQSNVGKNKKVTVNIDGKAVRLKPGETWVENSGISGITK